VIDLHTHILWGLDDGARTVRDSLEMCRIAFRDGIRTIVATPHTLNGLYQNDRPSILAKVLELNAALTRFPIHNPNSQIRNPKSHPILNPQTSFPLRILPGADVHLCEGTLSQLDDGKVTTLGDGGKCLLIEFPFNGIPCGSEEVLFQLMTRGIIPIISHPERNFEVGQNPRRYCEMIRMGCLGQVTAMSLTGGFGPEVRRLAEQLLTKGLIHIIASDAHSADGRPPVLSAAVRATAKIVSEDEAWKMVTEYPRALLEGRKPDVPLPNKAGSSYS
jgi:protein-tyrosine phosphatase